MYIEGKKNTKNKGDLKMIIEFRKNGNGENVGRIMKNNGVYVAVTAVDSNTYKTLKGAKNFMKRYNYKMVK